MWVIYLKLKKTQLLSTQSEHVHKFRILLCNSNLAVFIILKNYPLPKAMRMCKVTFPLLFNINRSACRNLGWVVKSHLTKYHISIISIKGEYNSNIKCPIIVIYSICSLMLFMVAQVINHSILHPQLPQTQTHTRELQEHTQTTSLAPRSTMLCVGSPSLIIPSVLKCITIIYIYEK